MNEKEGGREREKERERERERERDMGFADKRVNIQTHNMYNVLCYNILS